MSNNTIKKQAMLIGINDYQFLSKLSYARQDAEAIGNALKQNYGFTDKEVILLTDNRTGYFNPLNKQVIYKHLLDLDQQELDLFIFGFSGHGAYVNSERYFCPRDLISGTTEEQGLAFSKLQELISNIRAKCTLLILDCCQAISDKGIAEVMTAQELNTLSKATWEIGMKRKQYNPDFISNVAVLNSCTKGQCSWECNKYQHGIFTAHLLEAMNQRYDSVAKIIGYLDDHVPQTAMELGKDQKPFCKLEGSIPLPVNKYNKIYTNNTWENNNSFDNEYVDTNSTSHNSNRQYIHVPQDGFTLEEACKEVEDNGVIYLEPGIYTISEPIILNKNVTFQSRTSNAQDVEIKCNDIVFVIIDAMPRLIGVTIHAQGDNATGVVIMAGNPVIQSCNIVSDKATGICIQGEKSNPEIKSCNIYNCGWNGVIVCDGGTGKFHNCDIYKNNNLGIAIQTGGNPTVTGCKIHDGKNAGVYVLDNGIGEFNNCDVYGNEYSGIAVKTGGNPTVTGCKIHDGKNAGVYVLDNGTGEFNNCDIYRNTYPGVYVQTGGNPIVTCCKIHDGKQHGVWVYDNGTGKFNNCDIYGNEYSGIAVKTGSNPTVTGCKIHDDRQNGVWVSDNGVGIFSNCDIYSNTYPEIQIQTGGHPMVIGCKIHDGKNIGVYVFDNGAGEFHNNTLCFNKGDWCIASNAERVTGTGNEPKIPTK